MSRIGDQLNLIYTDLTTNVTEIYGRNNLHLAIDLVYHSPLSFYFGKTFIKKGYPEVLVIGDTRCGKTETAEKLQKHYQLGAMASCEGANFVGLFGGLHQIRNRWSVKWGAIPINHRRLLVIDEICDLSIEQIGSLSQLRSSGVAEITKIKDAKTHAQTRLIWLSNPRQRLPINYFSSGIQVIIDLIGKPEDIARFDMALILAKEDVPSSIINNPSRDPVKHVYTSQLCRNLVLWAWTRKPDNIHILPETADACRKYARLMYQKYSKDFPLVNAGEQRFKLARLAVALACRLFSTKDGINVIVKPEHVEYIHWWLSSEYDRQSFGYDRWSNRRKRNLSITNLQEVHQVLKNFGPQVVDQLLNTEQIGFKTVVDIHGTNDETIRPWFATLLQNNAMTKYNTYYRKTSAGIDIMKRYLANPEVEIGEF